MIGAAGRIEAVTIDRMDASQTRITPDDETWVSPTGREEDMVAVADLAVLPRLLSNPAAWVQYVSRATWRRNDDGEELEPWQRSVDEQGPAPRPSLVRIYGRDIVEVMIVYEPA